MYVKAVCWFPHIIIIDLLTDSDSDIVSLINYVAVQPTAHHPQSVATSVAEKEALYFTHSVDHVQQSDTDDAAEHTGGLETK